jgi:1-acyl-sn-glycerol-3-phosphate acyltransferase
MSRFLARIWLALWRWHTQPPLEPIPDRCVMIAAPHTTNWDFPITLAMASVSGVKIHWLGKDALFKGPMGPIMRRLGGVAIDRNAPSGMVAALADEINSHPQMVLVVPAEGTRSRTEHWKSGFYRIAEKAGVPIVCAFVDRSTRTGGFGPVITPTGDLRHDMDLIRAFYTGKEGLRPNRFGPVRLRDEVPENTDEVPE